MSSPVAQLFSSLLTNMSSGSTFGVFFTDEKRKRILKAALEAYYADRQSAVIFDTNRSWTGRMASLVELYPQIKVVCCVRDVGWVLDSIERLLRRNPLQTSRLFGFKTGSSVYGRCESLMHPDTGLVGSAWSTLREAWFGEFASHLVLVDYETLARGPARTLRDIYDALGEKPYQHDFDRVVYDEPDYDALVGMPGLHKVSEKVGFNERRSCLPPDLFHKYADLSFWKNPAFKREQIVLAGS